MNYRAIADVLPNLEIPDLGEKVQPLEAVVLVKALGADGSVNWYVRYTPSLITVEVLGALRAAEVLEEDTLRKEFRPVGGEDDR